MISEGSDIIYQTINSIAEKKAHLFAEGAALYYWREDTKNDLSGMTKRFGHFLATEDSLALAVRLLSMTKAMKTPAGNMIIDHQYIIHWDGVHGPTGMQTSFFRIKGMIYLYMPCISTHYFASMSMSL